MHKTLFRQLCQFMSEQKNNRAVDSAKLEDYEIKYSGFDLLSVVVCIF